MLTDEDSVRLIRDGAVAHLRLNRPAHLNALDVGMAARFLERVQEIAADRSVRAVLLSGEGRGFGAGGDIAEFVDPTGGSPRKIASIIDSMHAAIRLLTAMDAPVIAGLHGVVAGGSMSLALSCDLAIAAEGTRFNLAYANIASNCDVGGSYSLPRIVGLRQALRIALLSETVDAQEALTLGLVHRLVPADQLDTEAMALAQRLAGGATVALGRMKRLLRTSFDATLDAQLDAERDGFLACLQTQDFTEAVSAFRAKRKPVFSGR